MAPGRALRRHGVGPSVARRAPAPVAGDGPLGGHAVGNLLIASLWDLLGTPSAVWIWSAGCSTLAGGCSRWLRCHQHRANVMGADPGHSFEITTVLGQAAVAATRGRVLSVRLKPTGAARV